MKPKLQRFYCKDFFVKHCSFSIILINTITSIVTAVLFYYLIPLLLNYHPDFIEYNRRYTVDYMLQFFIITTLTVIVGGIILRKLLKSIDVWGSLLNVNSKISQEKISSIRTKLINMPYNIYIVQIIISFTVVVLFCLMYLVFFRNSWINLIKVDIVVLCFFTLSAIINFIFSKRVFTVILIKTYSNQNLEGKRIALGKKTFILILPVFITAVLFSSLFGYSKVLEERGNFIFRDYNNLLVNKFTGFDNVEDVNQVFKVLKDINVDNTKICHFVISPNGKIVTSDGNDLGSYFIKYLNAFSRYHNGRIYTDNGEYNGALIKIKGNNGIWIIGVKYNVISNEIIFYFCVCFLVLILLSVFVLFFFSQAGATDISLVGKKLTEISNEEGLNREQKIPVTSNDEIGELVVAFNKIRERQNDYDKLKTDFFANISHELRTPINVMLASIQLSELYLNKNSPKSIEQSSKNIKTINQNCLRLLRLINNLIDITKIDAGFIQFELQSLNIVNLIETITLSVSEYAKTKDIKLIFDTEIQKKIICCDPDKIERIMLNLLSNAIKFTDRNGDIFVKLYEKDKNIIISVKDSGIGIPKDKQEIIFERFRQVEQSLTKNYGGSGIGLSLVKAFIEMHEGKIYVESVEGKGSEFIIELPVKELSKDEGEQTDFQTIKSVNSNVEIINIEFSDIHI
jgi:signal transduction histidine kinase